MSVKLTPEAERQIDALSEHYEGKERLEALQALLIALEDAKLRILRAPAAGLPAPRPYPELEHPQRRWIKAGRYWIVYSLTKPPVILGVFYDAADIPGRF